MTKCEKYIDTINKNILPFIDYNRLQESYESEDKGYAKMVLYILHETAEQIYGPGVSCHGSVDFAVLPGVISSMKTGKVCLALLGVDLDSSGEHCSTDFLTKYGIVSQGRIENAKIQKFISETYGAYNYGFTLPVYGDIHQSPESQPQEIQEILSTFQKYAAELTDSILQVEHPGDEDYGR